MNTISPKIPRAVSEEVAGRSAAPDPTPTLTPTAITNMTKQTTMTNPTTNASMM
jgi:hypothetical protein